jgi:sec-independent protein translocase protein TatC
MTSAAITTGQKDASPETGSMSFLEHLEEFRRRVVYGFLYVVGGLCVCWGFHEKIFAILQRPIAVALANHHLEQKLVYLNPTDPFDTYLKVSFLAGVFVASPFVLYQLWAFIAPALYRNERRYVLPFLASTVGLFLAGGFFGYRLVYPSALDFLISFSGQFTPMITIGEYTSLFLTLRNSGDLHHRRDHYTNHRHYEHVRLCGTHDWSVSGEYRNCMVRTPDAEKESGGEH